MIDFGRSLRAAQTGDADAFARIWREFHPGLLRYLTIKAAPAAEDLAADVWTKVVGALPSFDGDESSFRAWIYTAARNRLTDWYRSSQRRSEPVEVTLFTTMPSNDRVERDVEERMSTDTAVAMIAQLSPAQAEAVMLRAVAGLDVTQTARVMGRSPGSVRVLCHRGLKLLERRLQQQGGGLVDGDRPPLPEMAPTDTDPVEVPSTLESA